MNEQSDFSPAASPPEAKHNGHFASAAVSTPSNVPCGGNAATTAETTATSSPASSSGEARVENPNYAPTMRLGLAARGLESALQQTTVMILAGGQGERLYPLTRDRAKPSVPFGGSYRIIDFALSNCINSGLRRIQVLTQYKSFSLQRHIKAGWDIFNPVMGEYLDVIPPQQRNAKRWYQGTADAIFQNIYMLEQEKPSYVIVLGGDHIYKMDYAKML
ncbi:MAG TPA: sugar phosphate nucleotidyltransferase, partial [Abditibacteriaceae bacterium]|nr:sugar phosphate nucleotidyltransferase [Abditibacteriaceae bacterium]